MRLVMTTVPFNNLGVRFLGGKYFFRIFAPFNYGESPHLITKIKTMIKIMTIFISLLSLPLADLPVYYASYYGGSRWNGNMTAGGEIFDDRKLTTAASKHYKMYEVLKVTNVSTGKSVEVVVNDRGAFSHFNNGKRRLDLSKAAFEKIAPLKQGVVKVHIEIIPDKNKLKH